MKFGEEDSLDIANGEFFVMSDIDFTQYDTSKPIREITYEVLKDLIISGQISPGSRIVESRFAKQFNISRTPIREALRKLEMDGLVEYTPRKGVVVKSLRIDDIKEIYDIRRVLEEMVLRQAVELVTNEDIAMLQNKLAIIENKIIENDVEQAANLSRDMHYSIFLISRLSRTCDILNSLDEYMHRFAFMSLSNDERRGQARIEHYEIVDALAKRDVERLVDLSTKHIESARAYCIQAYSSMLKENDKI